jgi:hypothetical protein
MVVNSVLLSTLCYFLSIWGNSTIVIHKIKSKLNNYLWSRKEQRTRIQVRWNDCTVPKQHGSLYLVDLEDALQALSAKWIAKALLPSNSNLQLLLQLKQLLQIRSHTSSQWAPVLLWCLTPNFHATNGSKVWNRAIRVWKKLSCTIDGVPPRNYDEVLHTSPWWSTFYIGRNSGFPADRAADLVKQGLSNIGA